MENSPQTRVIGIIADCSLQVVKRRQAHAKLKKSPMKNYISFKK